ncbi:MAG TPA: hypothetical protein VN213_09475, partial [Solirubrobacteraceae bacterium]|nr:hypothetical protein [Solirubrobacteraceae bacterium]
PEADDDPGAVAASDRLAATAPERRPRQPEVIAVAVVCTVATVVFGIYPEPLLDVANDAGSAISGLF